MTLFFRVSEKKFIVSDQAVIVLFIGFVAFEILTFLLLSLFVSLQVFAVGDLSFVVELLFRLPFVEQALLFL
ncbi:hypothetical protein [Atopobium minutum]|uniref:hypothetical protein n=1 Tax=Atopobium minutum TaxID=1381 RepID=UPI000944D439|nr:hypothetical protein [Atopobium minutum]